MRAAIKSALRVIESERGKRAVEAMEALDMVIFWSTSPRQDLWHIRAIFGSSLMGLKRRLTPGELEQIVDRVDPLIGSSRLSIQLVNVFSSIPPEMGLVRVLAIIRQRWEKIDNATRQQLLSVLSGYMRYRSDNFPYMRVVKAIRKANPRPYLTRAARSRDRELRRQAEYALIRLDQYLTGRSEREFRDF